MDSQLWNESECLFCGRCKEACPQDSIFFKRELPNRNDLLNGEISVAENECIYCGICAEICPTDAITLTSSNGKFLDAIEIDEKKCVYCCVCKRTCPQDAIKAVVLLVCIVKKLKVLKSPVPFLLKKNVFLVDGVKMFALQVQQKYLNHLKVI